MIPVVDSIDDQNVVSVPVAVALGGNLGAVERTFGLALEALEKHGMTQIRRSSVMHTKPVGCPDGTPDFCNAALVGEWHGSAMELLEVCQGIEQKLGRARNHGFHTSRTLDLDVILFGNEEFVSEALTVPHPQAAERDFVLEPLNEIAANWLWGKSQVSVGEMLTRLRKCNAGKVGNS